MSEFKLTLKNFFDKLGLSYTLSLNGLIRRQQGIDAASYVPVERIAHSKKGKSFKRSGRRLMNTGRYNQEAFVHNVTDTTLTIEGNPKSYDANVTYADITAYNDKNSPYLRGKHGATIQQVGPSIFPWTEQEFLNTLQNVLIVDLEQAITEDVLQQVEEYLESEIPKKIDVSL